MANVVNPRSTHLAIAVKHVMLVMRLVPINSGPHSGDEAQAISPRDVQMGPAGQRLEQRIAVIIHQIDRSAIRW